MHQIGAGVLGPVFRAYRPPHDRPFAVKAFHIDITPEQAETLTELFGRLVSAGAFHRGAVPATAVGIDDGVLYLAQEYVAAESLDVAMRRYAPTPLERALPLIDRLAGAIDAAHARGLAHGGLHLRDIFATPSGGRVTGFGVVPALEEMGVMGPIRRPYTAPEMIARRPWGGAADRFALAAVAYELLTGKRATGTGTQFAARLDEVENVADVEALQAVFETALADKPDDRYPSALRFATDVRAAVGMPREDEPEEEEPEEVPAPPPAGQPAAAVDVAGDGVVPDVIIRDEEAVAASEPAAETGAEGAREESPAVAGNEDLRDAAEAPEDPPAHAGSTSAGREAAEASDAAPRRAGRYGLADEDRDFGDTDHVAFEVEEARGDEADDDEAAPEWSDAGLGAGLAGARDFAGRADDPDAPGAGEDVPYRRGASGSVLAIAVVLSVGAGAAYVVGLRLAGEPGRAGAPVAAGEIALSAAPAGTPPSAEARRPEADAGAPALDPTPAPAPAVSPPAAPPAAAPSTAPPAVASSPTPAAASPPPPAAVSPPPPPVAASPSPVPPAASPPPAAVSPPPPAAAPSPASPAPSPPPPPAAASPPPAPVPAPPPPPVAVPPLSPPPVTASPPSPAAAPPPAADAPEPAPAAADAAAPAGGWLLIRTTPPGAAVTINGQDHGRTPLALGDMPFGTYRVEVGIEGFQSVTRELELAPDATVASAAIELPRAAAPPPEPVVGGIAVTSRPSGARVLLDGQDVGVTPTVISDVAAGAHDLRIELDGYRPWLASVDVPAADQVRVGASLDHLPER